MKSAHQLDKKLVAFGAPGIRPHWTSSSKDGIGVAYHTGFRLGFTLSHGIVNEVYYTHVDTPNLQFLITDGETFCHEEKSDLDHLTELPEQSALLYPLTNSDREGRYRIGKEIIGEPHSSVLLIHTRLEIMEPKSFRGIPPDQRIHRIQVFTEYLPDIYPNVILKE